MKLAEQVLLGDLHVEQRHADIFMAQQFHKRRKADAEPDHLRGIAVAESMRGDVIGAAYSNGQLRVKPAGGLDTVCGSPRAAGGSEWIWPGAIGALRPAVS